jgi:hypothetical protein
MIPRGFGFVEPKALEMAHGWRKNPTAARTRSVMTAERTASQRMGLQADGYQPPQPNDLHWDAGWKVDDGLFAARETDDEAAFSGQSLDGKTEIFIDMVKL